MELFNIGIINFIHTVLKKKHSMEFNLANFAIFTIYSACKVSTDYEQPKNSDFECIKLTHITLEPVGYGAKRILGFFVKLSFVLIVFVQASCRLLILLYIHFFSSCFSVCIAFFEGYQSGKPSKSDIFYRSYQ